MNINRTKNTIRGTATGTVRQIFNLLIPFVVRTIFIRTLGMEYTGLNGLFSSILQVLNLIELGVGSALVFSMYKPIAEDDTEKICALMRLYRLYYRIIGLVILCIGLLIIPFLPMLIHDDLPEDVNLYLLYLMNLFNTVLTYWLFAYRNCLFQAHQRLDVTHYIGLAISGLMYGSQIAILLLFKNYYLYLSAAILFQIISNVVTALVSKKYYPQYAPVGKIEKEEVRAINKKVLSLFTAKLGNVIHHSFDTIVISAFLGLSTLAVYQNYYYIITSVRALVVILFAAAQAGIGNFLVSKDDFEKRKLLYAFQYVSMLIAAVCCACFMNLFQPFMVLWVGESFLLDFPIVILLIVSFALDIFMRPLLMFKDGGGMWNEDKFRPLVSALANLALNLLSVTWWGLYGVIASTIISLLLIAVPWLLSNVNKYQFKIKIKKFLIKNLFYTLVITISCVASYFLCGVLNITNPYLALFVRLIISTVIPSGLFLAFFCKTEENKYCISLLKTMLHRNKRQKAD